MSARFQPARETNQSAQAGSSRSLHLGLAPKRDRQGSLGVLEALWGSRGRACFWKQRGLGV